MRALIIKIGIAAIVAPYIAAATIAAMPILIINALIRFDLSMF